MTHPIHRVGLIINPMAGRDIRRLVAHASLQSQPEKALAAHRIIAGVNRISGMEVLLPDDQAGFFSWLQTDLSREARVQVIPRSSFAQDSTAAWIVMLVEAGAEALIVVGGDGTQRNAAQAYPEVPMLPVAGGTNNVACYLGDQTAGGYAVALWLDRRLSPQDGGDRAKVLHVRLSDGREDMALIDVALTTRSYTGAMAVWDVDDVEALVLSRADPVRPGLSNAGGFLDPISFEEDRGLYVTLGPGGAPVPAVLAPGLMVDFPVLRHRSIAFEETVTLARTDGPGTLSLDGERTIVLKAGQSADVTLDRDGPWMLDPAKIFRGPS